jgi:hypothetical protein
VGGGGPRGGWVNCGVPTARSFYAELIVFYQRCALKALTGQSPPNIPNSRYLTSSSLTPEMILPRRGDPLGAGPLRGRKQLIKHQAIDKVAPTGLGTPVNPQCIAFITMEAFRILFD